MAAQRSAVRAQVIAGLAAAGSRPDTRFGGQGGAGTFPLDGAFSPDKKTIVFDGAVEKDGAFGVLLCRINADGTGFTILRPPLQVMPMFSNNHTTHRCFPATADGLDFEFGQRRPGPLRATVTADSSSACWASIERSRSMIVSSAPRRSSSRDWS